MGLKDAAVNIFSAHKAAGWTVESRCAREAGEGGGRVARGAVVVGGGGQGEGSAWMALQLVNWCFTAAALDIACFSQLATRAL